jgi:hypothetical protein
MRALRASNSLVTEAANARRRAAYAKALPWTPRRAAAWATERATALLAIADLSDAVQAELHATAASGTNGIALRPEQPLYTIALIAAYRRMVSTA